jgi:small-conductance mechanosensitive channel
MIRKTDGELVVVPNRQLFKSNVEVLTNRPKRRLRITCGVGYGENIDEAREVIREASAGCDTATGPKSVEKVRRDLRKGICQLKHRF